MKPLKTLRILHTIKLLYGYLILLFTMTACSDVLTDDPLTHKPGYCMTFDDNYIEDWFAITDLLIANRVNATFFVSEAGNLTPNEILLLQKLKNYGFEIGSHGFHHTNAVEYLTNHTLDEYYKYEIKPAISLMDSLGMKPTSFAYPFGKSSDTLDQFLLNYFKILRHVPIEQFAPPTKEADEINEIFYKANGKRYTAGLGIDINYQISLEQLSGAFQRAKNNNEIIILFAHRPVNSQPEAYETRVSFLDSVFRLANTFNLKNYRFSELPDLN